MRVSVRAGEVREGDRLIVPDGEGGEREIGVTRETPTPVAAGSGIVWLTPHIARQRDEWVVVERPDPPITITVELTAEEALEYARHMPAFSVTTLDPTLRVKAKVRAAIVAARAGETR